MPVQSEAYRLYNAKDAYAAVRAVSPSLLRDLDEFGLRNVYDRIVRPLGPVIVRLNAKGLYVDVFALEAAKQFCIDRVAELQSQIDEICGRPMDVGGDAFRHFVYEELDIKAPKIGKKGLGSTDEGTLKALGETRPDVAELFDMVLELRSQNKTRNTFLKGAQPANDGRVYAGFRIGPVTGRLACRRPNFQNIPLGIGRKVFCATQGCKFIYADYSQLQARIFSILAGDDILLNTIDSGGDIHEANAREIFVIPPETLVDVKLRFAAKTFFYGNILFGGGIGRITARGSEMLGSKESVLMEDMSIRWFAAHPAITKYRERIRTELVTTKRLVGPFGRHRIFFDDINEAIRAGYNFPIQNGEGDMVALRLIDIDREYPNELCLQLHDAIMLETPNAEVEERASWLKGLLEQRIPELNNYSFPVEVKVGESWGDF